MLKFTSAALLSLALTACGGGGGGSSQSTLSATPSIISSAQAQAAAAPGGVQGIGPIIDTGPFPCDSQPRHWVWRNPFSTPKKVVMVRQWVGFDYTLESDTQVDAYVVAPGDVPIMMLVIQQLDNYKHRSFEQERWVSFAPNYIEVPVGGGIALHAYCNRIAGGTNAHVNLAVWFL